MGPIDPNRLGNHEPFSSVGVAFRSQFHLAGARAGARFVAETDFIERRPAESSELLATKRQIDHGGCLGSAHRALSAGEPGALAVAVFAPKPGAVSQDDRVLCGYRTAHRRSHFQSNPSGA